MIIATYGVTIGRSIIVDQHDDPSSAERKTCSVWKPIRKSLSVPAGNVTYGGCNVYRLLFDNIILENFDRCPYFSLQEFVASHAQVTRRSGIVLKAYGSQSNNKPQQTISNSSRNNAAPINDISRSCWLQPTSLTSLVGDPVAAAPSSCSYPPLTTTQPASTCTDHGSKQLHPTAGHARHPRAPARSFVPPPGPQARRRCATNPAFRCRTARSA